ncbi:MAG: gliding motility-associated C-terminal domain-containing protein [Saprospiraceae bacterium]
MNSFKLSYFLLSFFFAASSLVGQSIFPVDTVHSYTVDCGGSQMVCVPLPSTDFSDFAIFMDGNPYAANVVGCDYDTTFKYSYNALPGLGNMGPYHLDSWLVNGTSFDGTFQNIPDLVQMLNQWDPQGAWVHEPATLTISGGASGKSYSSMQVTVMQNQTQATIGLSYGLLPKGSALEFSLGMHSIIAWNLQSGQKDTLMVQVECLLPPPSMTFYDTIPADSLPYTICLDTTQLFGAVATAFNACPDESGQFVSFYLDPVNLCLKYEGLMCNGTETACIVVCDNLGMCDTTYFVITVDDAMCMSASRKVVDTVLINFSDVICLDTSILPGAILSVENLCPGESGESVDFEYDETTHCVSYTGFAVGLDQACYLLTDVAGNTDTVFVCVYVKLPESGIIIDTILLGQNETYCLDSIELAGNIISIENFCPEFSGDQVEFTTDLVTLCVEAQGISVGTDSACIIICDDYGVCDTTYFYITVVTDVNDPCAGALPPIAVDDTASTLLNTPVNIDILANDTLGICLPVSLTVLDPTTGGIGPNNGLTVLNPDQTVDYVPNTDFCGLDTFQYVLCSQVGCDTATVVVDISCAETMDTIIIYNGFSPNGDGTNEYFKIENIDKFPDNHVRVYNRWGLLVFEQKGYKNTWGGFYKGTSLPDGTYFYLIDIDFGDRDKQTYSGFVIINR